MMEPLGTYGWGLDGSVGTVITDYIFGGLCSVYGICILHLYLTSSSETTVKNTFRGINRHCDDLVKKSRTLMLVLSLAFIICGLMNAVGALLHHFVPFVEPVLQPPDDAAEWEKGLTFWGQIKLQLYPWFMVWQVANIFGTLYGLFTILSAVYAIEFDALLREAAIFIEVATNSGQVQYSNRFRTVKRIITGLVCVVFLWQFGIRFWRIHEYLSTIYNDGHDIEENIDVTTARQDIDKLGWAWSGRTATVVIFLSYVVNAVISTYMMLRHIFTQGKKSYKSFGGSKVGLLRVLGAWMLTIGGIIQVFFASKCASNSPTDCPFPPAFNHNAWYHVFQGVGMTFWFFAEWSYFRQQPTSVLKRD